MLTLKGYKDLEGVKGALKKRADEIFKNLVDEEKQAAERIFLELTHIGEGAEDTRRRVSKTKLKTKLASAQLPESLLDQVVQKLADEKLVVTSGDSAAESMVEVAHEALIRHWPRLRDWVDTNREAIRTERKIQVAAEEWRDAGKPEQDYLWTGTQLDRATNYSGRIPLSNLAKEFIQASIASQEKQKAVSRQGIEDRLRMQTEKVEELLSSQPLEGLLLAIQMIDRNQKELEELSEESLSFVRDSLLRAIEVARERNILIGHKSPVSSVAFSPDGQTIVSGSSDGTVWLWDLEGKPIGHFIGHEAPVCSVAFSPDGETIVSGSRDKTVRLWNLKDSSISPIIRRHEAPVYSVAISLNGETIVSGSGDGTVHLWRSNGTRICKPLQHDRAVYSVAISPDGETIVSGSNNGTVWLWKKSNGTFIGEPFGGHDKRVKSVAFSRDEKTIVSGSLDKTVQLWRLKDNSIKPIITRHEIRHQDSVNSVAISPDGETIVSGSTDKKVQLWDRKKNPISSPFIGHKSSVNSVAISPDGQTIASGSWDCTVRLWDVEDKPMSQPFIVRENWETWLQVACDRLRYHPIFKNPESDVAKEACEICRKYVWKE